MIRGRTNINIDKKNKKQIIIDQIPYQINKTNLLEKIAKLIDTKIIKGISDLRDESDRDGMRIVLDLHKGAVSSIILNQLYRNTPLQSYYSTHFLAISNGQPKTFNLRNIMNEFITFRKEIVTRRTRFRLIECETKLHLLLAIITALENIDFIVNIIRSSVNIHEAKSKLINSKFINTIKTYLHKYKENKTIHTLIKQKSIQLDEIQINAILKIHLSR